jgi:heme-degrading monooxygenase HmoA
MVLEVAILDVIPGQEAAFERDFSKAQKIITSMAGYLLHTLSRCLKTPNRYSLLVYWETLEAHIGGFRGIPEYQEWKTLFHHYYDPFPTVEHDETVFRFP